MLRLWLPAGGKTSAAEGIKWTDSSYSLYLHVFVFASPTKLPLTWSVSLLTFLLCSPHHRGEGRASKCVGAWLLAGVNPPLSVLGNNSSEMSDGQESSLAEVMCVHWLHLNRLIAVWYQRPSLGSRYFLLHFTWTSIFFLAGLLKGDTTEETEVELLCGFVVLFSSFQYSRIYYWSSELLLSKLVIPCCFSAAGHGALRKAPEVHVLQHGLVTRFLFPTHHCQSWDQSWMTLYGTSTVWILCPCLVVHSSRKMLNNLCIHRKFHKKWSQQENLNSSCLRLCGLDSVESRRWSNIQTSKLWPVDHTPKCLFLAFGCKGCQSQMPYCDSPQFKWVVWPVVQRASVKGVQAGYQHLEDFPHNPSSPGVCLRFTEQLNVLLSSVIWQRMACSGHFSPFNSLRIVLTEKIWKPGKWQRKRTQLKQQERDNIK